MPNSFSTLHLSSKGEERKGEERKMALLVMAEDIPLSPPSSNLTSTKTSPVSVALLPPSVTANNRNCRRCIVSHVAGAPQLRFSSRSLTSPDKATLLPSVPATSASASITAIAS